MNALLLALWMGLTDASATVWLDEPDVETMADESAAVIRGTVVERRVIRGEHGLSTRWVVAVDEVVAGQAAEEVVIELNGGRLGDRVETVAGSPSWEVGSEVIVFVPVEGPVSLQGTLTVSGDLLLDPHARPEALVPLTVRELVERIGD